MSQPVWFSVVADYRAFLEDSSADANYDGESVPISGTVTFTPLVNNGDVVRALDAEPRPIGYISAPVTAIIDGADGRLKLRTSPDAGGTGTFAPVRLLSGTGLELTGPLFYRVDFTNVTYANGRRGTIASFVFEAPSVDQEVNLISVGRAAGQTATNLIRPTVSVGTTTTSEPGEDAEVTQRGSETARIFDFTIPRGDAGPEGPVGPPGTTLWDGISGKPAVIGAGATQADARAAIGAGTSNLELGTTSSTAKAGNYTPNASEVTTALGYTPESTANKGQPSGYASLDASGLVPSAQLPSFVDDVIEGANLAAFPATGEASKIYTALDTNKVYRWGGSSYVEISPSPGSTDAVPEGSTNLYFTTTRAQNALTTQLSGKADVSHVHSQSDVTGLSTTLAGKSDVGHGHIESDITGLTSALAGKEPTVTAGTTGQYYRGDKTFQTLDTTAVTEGTNLYYTDARADARVAPATAAASDKATPVDADVVPLVDSAASNTLKKLSWANIKTALAAYYDSLVTTMTGKTLASPALTGTTQVATGGTVELYNVGSSGATNYERAQLGWSANTFSLLVDRAGTGAGRAARLQSGNIFLQVNASSLTGSPVTIDSSSNASVTATMLRLVSTMTGGSSSSQSATAILPTISQSGTASYTALLINPTETATGSGTKRLIDAQVGGTTQFNVGNTGNVFVGGTLDLGNASDTTLSRSAAGRVAVEGVDLVDVSSTQTLTSKTLTSPRVNQLLDSNGNAIVELVASAGTPINYIRIGNTPFDTPVIQAVGSDSNVNLGLQSKGTAAAIRFFARNVANDAFSVFNVASGVNHLRASGSATGNPPTLSALGSDTNISINLVPKNDGTVQANGVPVSTNSTTSVHTAQQIELGHATDTTITRTSAGMVAVEGNPLAVRVAVPATTTSTGASGQYAADNDWLYIATGTNTWRRVALGTW